MIDPRIVLTLLGLLLLLSGLTSGRRSQGEAVPAESEAAPRDR